MEIKNFWANLIQNTETSWQRVREIIKKRDKYICRYCGAFDLHGDVDHILPLEKGGTDAIYNLVWSCANCNRSKGNKTLREWADYLLSEEREKTKRMIHDFLMEYEQVPDAIILALHAELESLRITEDDFLNGHPEVCRMIDGLTGLHEMMIKMDGVPESMILAAQRYTMLLDGIYHGFRTKKTLNDTMKNAIAMANTALRISEQRGISLDDKENKEALGVANNAFIEFIKTIDIDLDDDTLSQLKLL